MNKNVVIGILALAVLIESGVLAFGKLGIHGQPLAMMGASAGTVLPRQTGQNPQMAILTKGMKLSDSPIAQYAYQVAPGNLSSDAKQALNGFAMTTHANADGSLQINLAPKDSSDQSQQYIVRPGEALFFVEMTPADDQVDTDKDLNYRDDYGVITDANGIVQ